MGGGYNVCGVPSCTCIRMCVNVHMVSTLLYEAGSRLNPKLAGTVASYMNHPSKGWNYSWVAMSPRHLCGFLESELQFSQLQDRHFTH